MAKQEFWNSALYSLRLVREAFRMSSSAVSGRMKRWISSRRDEPLPLTLIVLCSGCEICLPCMRSYLEFCLLSAAADCWWALETLCWTGMHL